MVRKKGQSPVVPTLAEHERRYDGGCRRVHVHHGTACEVQRSKVADPSASPNPVTHRRIDQ